MNLTKLTVGYINSWLYQQLPISTFAYINSCLYQQLPISTIAYINNCLYQQLPISTIAYINNCLHQHLPINIGLYQQLQLHHRHTSRLENCRPISHFLVKAHPPTNVLCSHVVSSICPNSQTLFSHDHRCNKSHSACCTIIAMLSRSSFLTLLTGQAHVNTANHICQTVSKRQSQPA
jgi:hypothetical protein